MATATAFYENPRNLAGPGQFRRNGVMRQECSGEGETGSERREESAGARTYSPPEDVSVAAFFFFNNSAGSWSAGMATLKNPIIISSQL